MSTKKKIIKIKNENIDFIFRRSKKAKYMRLEISSGGEILAVRPRWVSMRIMEKFIERKADWILNNLKKNQSKELNVFHQYSKENYLKHRKEAFDYIKGKMNYFNKIYQFKYCKISIRNQKTRWGSCSSSGNLSFNYKIIFLPEDLADYIVVHELCHLWEMNHSQKFWKLVAKAIPDYKKRRKRLRNI